ncbi:F0F1 ATP synthase subunit B [Profundibacter amoris]|uniref:ATP synthase subunit b n=1 Tax=Profundibacter amoris TaxID=2171755 RepID=A0A347UKD7_9RHOB|nr:F0F1 ATP synthase subunit B [Profundibacter amoris]AXX99315.1 F0F1 ATP synthase subunit B [Profundibacter amoris]
MKKLTVLLVLIASPALAAEGPFFSLKNPEFVVVIGFVLFLALLAYLKVPGLIGGMLDKRAEGIKSDLDEAKALREEAQTILASYERKQKEVQEQADRIVEAAKAEAEIAATQAKEELKASIARRLAAADEQITSAQASAVKEVRDTAIAVAVAAAEDVIAKKLTAADGNALIEDAIKDVAAKLH